MRKAEYVPRGSRFFYLESSEISPLHCPWLPMIIVGVHGVMVLVVDLFVKVLSVGG